jgi:hypothetical protein
LTRHHLFAHFGDNMQELLMLRRNVPRVRHKDARHFACGPGRRLFTRRGYDWTDRYPAIARAAAKLRAKSFTIDGEAAVCGPDEIAIFDSIGAARLQRPC